MSDLPIRAAAPAQPQKSQAATDSRESAITADAGWTRRATLEAIGRGGFGTILAASGLSAAFAATDDLVRIGDQKSSSLILILKSQCAIEKAQAPLGVKVAWFAFSSGLPLLEGMNVGAIDLSADVADTTPLFAQAAGAKLTDLAQEKPSPTARSTSERRRRRSLRLLRSRRRDGGTVQQPPQLCRGAGR